MCDGIGGRVAAIRGGVVVVVDDGRVVVVVDTPRGCASVGVPSRPSARFPPSTRRSSPKTSSIRMIGRNTDIDADRRPPSGEAFAELKSCRASKSVHSAKQMRPTASACPAEATGVRNPGSLRFGGVVERVRAGGVDDAVSGGFVVRDAAERFPPARGFAVLGDETRLVDDRD